MAIHLTSSETSWEAVQSFYASVPLAAWRDAKMWQEAFCSSYARCFAYFDGTLIGCGRAISDGMFYSLIVDVAVSPAFQRRGVGSQIMRYLMAKLPQRSQYLISVPDQQEFYRKLGFRKLKTGFGWFTNPEKQVELGYLD